jgi:hypothetical protein
MCHNVKKDGGKCISIKVKLIATSFCNESILEGSQTLKHILLNTLETFMIAIRGPKPRRPLNANGKIYHIRTW